MITTFWKECYIHIKFAKSKDILTIDYLTRKSLIYIYECMFASNDTVVCKYI
jgi:hypothetical protein